MLLRCMSCPSPLQIFFVFGLITNLVVSALLVLGGSAVITAVTGAEPDFTCGNNICKHPG